MKSRKNVDWDKILVKDPRDLDPKEYKQWENWVWAPIELGLFDIAGVPKSRSIPHSKTEILCQRMSDYIRFHNYLKNGGLLYDRQNSDPNLKGIADRINESSRRAPNTSTIDTRRLVETSRMANLRLPHPDVPHQYISQTLDQIGNDIALRGEEGKNENM